MDPYLITPPDPILSGLAALAGFALIFRPWRWARRAPRQRSQALLDRAEITHRLRADVRPLLAIGHRVRVAGTDHRPAALVVAVRMRGGRQQVLLEGSTAWVPAWTCERLT